MKIDVEGFKVTRHGVWRKCEPAMSENICLQEVRVFVVNKRPRVGNDGEDEQPNNNGCEEEKKDACQALCSDC